MYGLTAMLDERHKRNRWWFTPLRECSERARTSKIKWRTTIADAKKCGPNWLSKVKRRNEIINLAHQEGEQEKARILE